MLINGAPHFVSDMLAQAVEGIVGENVELLVGGRVDEGFVAEPVNEKASEAHGKGHGLLAELEVEGGRLRAEV